MTDYIDQTNVGNIRGDDLWLGAIGHDANGEIIFDTQQHGVRVMCRCIQQAVNAGRDTVRRLITGGDDPSKAWTATAADWPDYIEFVLAGARLKEDSWLVPIFGGHVDYATLGMIIRAMAEFEHGVGFTIPTSVLLEGIAMFSRDFLKD